MDIKYKLTIHSYWHCGSGLSRGADVDSLVVKDSNNLPFVPGKTVKGLIREAVEDYIGLSAEEGKEPLFEQIFGSINNRSEVYFGNAELTDDEKAWIKSQDVAHLLYKKIASTAIDENGRVKDHSLRSIEVTVPCVLHGEIHNVPEEAEELIYNAMGMIKCLGSNRNHGLGRCTLEKEKGGNE